MYIDKHMFWHVQIRTPSFTCRLQTKNDIRHYDVLFNWLLHSLVNLYGYLQGGDGDKFYDMRSINHTPTFLPTRVYFTSNTTFIVWEGLDFDEAVKGWITRRFMLGDMWRYMYVYDMYHHESPSLAPHKPWIH